MTDPRRDAQRPPGKLLVLLPGLGAVATTLIAGVELCRRGRGSAIGSLAELGRVPVDDAPSGSRPVRELVSLAALEDLEFAAWDLFPRDACAAAVAADVLTAEHVEELKEFLSAIVPMPGVHDGATVPHLEPQHAIDPRRSKREQAETIRADIRRALARTGAARAVCVLLTSTEVRQPVPSWCRSLAALERALDEDDASVTPSQLCAYACLREEVPVANGTPNTALELPALQELAREGRLPIAGRDLKSGQTMLKTALAPALMARELGLLGWFSANILGNADGLSFYFKAPLGAGERPVHDLFAQLALLHGGLRHFAHAS